MRISDWSSDVCSSDLPGEPLRLMERTVRLPGSNVAWRFMVAQARASLDQQIAVLRSTLIKSFAILGLGLIIMATLQTFYGLRPLRSVRLEISRMRTGDKNRVTAPLQIRIAHVCTQVTNAHLVSRFLL